MSFAQLIAQRRRPLPWASVALGLDSDRAEQLNDVLARNQTLVRSLRLDLAAAYDHAVAARLDQGGNELVAALRHIGSPWRRGVDALLRTRMTEVIDWRRMPPVVKRHEMALLDRLNRRLGHYEHWGRALRDTVAAGGLVVELAAGSGGFVRYLREHQAPLRVIATDLEAKNADVVYCDVHDLSTAPARPDLFFCAQAVHHFSPGTVLRLVAQALRLAPQGLVIVDLMRATFLAVGGALIGLFLAPYFPPTPIDAVLSVRRSYTPAELELLARVAGAQSVSTRFAAPAHFILHAHSPA